MGELKPCPFCGSMLVEAIEAGTTGLFVVACLACGCQGPTLPDHDAVVTHWNTRTADTNGGG
jgi:Lar family restriction alleviation protein